ncbi:MAG: hypothetical protein ACU4EQ_09190 [Candidatus Nitrosoglobus sp.]
MEIYCPGSDDYLLDFVDLITINECPCGRVNSEDNWRGISNYSSLAAQISLTATSKRSGNLGTYTYFGEDNALVRGEGGGRGQALHQG